MCVLFPLFPFRLPFLLRIFPSPFFSSFDPSLPILPFLFLQWATLVRQDGELSLDVYTHGYAYRQVSLSNASGAGRIFYALAKSFAGLPKLPVTSGAATPVETPSLASADLSSRQGEEVFEHLLEVGGREGTVDETVELANATIAAVDGTLPITPIAITATSPSLSSSAASASYFPSRAASVTSLPSISSRRDTVDSEAWPVAFPPPSFSREQLAQFHKNVHSRLLPFLGIKLPERRVRITIYPAVGSDVLARTYLTTSAPGGGWTTSLKIKGAELATLLSSAGGDEEVKIRVLAELIEPEKVTYVDIPVPESASQMVGGGRGGRAATAAAPTKQAVPAPEGWEETAMVTATDSVALTVGGKEKEAEGGKIRVVSDVDDTVKVRRFLPSFLPPLLSPASSPKTDLLLRTSSPSSLPPNSPSFRAVDRDHEGHQDDLPQLLRPRARRRAGAFSSFLASFSTFSPTLTFPLTISFLI